PTRRSSDLEAELAHAATVVDTGEPVDELVERDTREEEELHGEDADQRAATEAREDVVQRPHEGDRGDAPDHAERQARDDGGAGEQDEAAPAVEPLEDRLDPAAREVDALEAREGRLDGLRHALAPVP